MKLWHAPCWCTVITDCSTSVCSVHCWGLVCPAYSSCIIFSIHIKLFSALRAHRKMFRAEVMCMLASHLTTSDTVSQAANSSIGCLLLALNSSSMCICRIPPWRYLQIRQSCQLCACHNLHFQFIRSSTATCSPLRGLPCNV